MKHIIRCYGKDSSVQLANTLKQVGGDNPVYFCIGSDKFLLDSLGPKVGTRLKERSNGSLIVYGVEGDTIKAYDVKKAYRAVKYIHPKSKIIAIDAATGSHVGEISVIDGGICPGSGVGKDLGVVGNNAIICSIGPYFLYEPDERERLEKLVNEAADTIADAILLAAS